MRELEQNSFQLITGAIFGRKFDGRRPSAVFSATEFVGTDVAMTSVLIFCRGGGT